MEDYFVSRSNLRSRVLIQNIWVMITGNALSVTALGIKHGTDKLKQLLEVTAKLSESATVFLPSLIVMLHGLVLQ